MGEWDVYQNRMGVRGDTRRASHRSREFQNLASHLPDSLSYTEAVVYPPELSFNIDRCETPVETLRMNVAVINSDNLNEKMIMAMPGEEIENGSLVHWMDMYWLITEQDANDTLYRRSKMLQCNHLLKWVNQEHVICEQWCVTEDGTKYLTGELEDRMFIVTRGDARIAITIAKNSETVKLNRQSRFLVDDPDDPEKMAFALTKPLKFAGLYGGHGVYKFVCQEVNTTDDDNRELGIADYYQHFTHETDEYGNPVVKEDDTVLPEIPEPDTPVEERTGRGKWM